MRNYRLYCFDGANKITTAHVLAATNDAEAVIAAKRNMDDCIAAELWDCDRLVMRIPTRQLH